MCGAAKVELAAAARPERERNERREIMLLGNDLSPEILVRKVACVDTISPPAKLAPIAMPDLIHIEQLELLARLGVPDDERATPQRLALNLMLEPANDFRALDDRIENTVDYFVVAQTVQQLAAARPRHLLETLAEEIAQEVLTRFAVRAVEVELRKFILPDTAFVAVRLKRERAL